MKGWYIAVEQTQQGLWWGLLFIPGKWCVGTLPHLRRVDALIAACYLCQAELRRAERKEREAFED